MSKPGNAAEKLLRRDGFPAIGAADQLGPRRRAFIDSMKKSSRERAVSHAIFEFTLQGCGKQTSRGAGATLMERGMNEDGGAGDLPKTRYWNGGRLSRGFPSLPKSNDEG